MISHDLSSQLTTSFASWNRKPKTFVRRKILCWRARHDFFIQNWRILSHSLYMFVQYRCTHEGCIQGTGQANVVNWRTFWFLVWRFVRDLSLFLELAGEAFKFFQQYLNTFWSIEPFGWELLQIQLGKIVSIVFQNYGMGHVSRCKVVEACFHYFKPSHMMLKACSCFHIRKMEWFFHLA